MEQRQEYYKNLRKQQKKKRKERANLSEGELKRGQATTRSRRRLVIDLPKEPSKKRRLGDSEQNLPRGKRMVSASLQKNQGKKRKIWFETKVLGRSVAALSEIVTHNTAAFL